MKRHDCKEKDINKEYKIRIKILKILYNNIIIVIDYGLVHVYMCRILFRLRCICMCKNWC